MYAEPSRIPKRHSTSSILQISQPNLQKKKKRISFSNNLIFQELYEDGTTRIFEENFDEKLEQVSMAIDESDSIFDKTVYGDEKMDFSFLDSPKMVSGSPLISNNSNNNIKSSLDNSFSATLTETADNFYDSILVFACENSILELSDAQEELSSNSITDHHSTTFIGTFLTDGKESETESDHESDDDLLGFINNSVASVTSTRVVDMALIDEKLWPHIIELNDEFVSLKLMAGNFTAVLNHDISDESKTLVVTQTSLQCNIDEIIETKGFTNISNQVIHTLQKPRDDKLITVLKKTVAAHFTLFQTKVETENDLNSALKSLLNKFSRIEALFVSLAHLFTLHEYKIVCADVRNFEIALELMGLRYTMWLVMCFDLLSYPDEVVKVKFGIHKLDLKLYPYHFFHKAMRSIKPGASNYLDQLVNRAKKYIHDTRNNHTRKPIRLSIFPGKKAHQTTQHIQQR